MPGSADTIQGVVHALEAGGAAIWLRRALALLAVIALSLYYFIHEFQGLATSQAMDQAQIGRQIASGHGWRTNVIRPLSIGQLQRHGKNVPQRIWYDTYNAPLPPLVDAIALLPVKGSWKMTPRDINYVGDRAIVFVAIGFFIGSLVIFFFIARRLFDQRLALLACALVLICDTIWQYSLSGLPQMLLLFLFCLTSYLLVRAVQAQFGGGPVGIWLALVGVGFGLLALTHAITIWIFVGAFIYSVFFFKPRGYAAIIILIAFVILYAPWLVRTFIVCGHPGGVAMCALFDGVRHSEVGWLRQLDFDLVGIGPGAFRVKLAAGFTTQLAQLFGYLGWSIVAPLFFVSLLHRFKRPETAAMRWMILSMWLGAVLGMDMCGLHEEQNVAPNQLHLLFIPLMTCYGLAFLLVLWNRLEIDLSLARVGFLTLLFLLCGWPMLDTMLFAPRKAPVRWPPYVPPYIAVLNNWMKPNEITASDMPSAIAWYADRPSLLLPDSVLIMTDLNDYRTLGAPINALYLTPVSGSQNTLGDILKGEYQNWAAVILRSIDMSKFPLPWATLLGLENGCVFYSDHDRQRVQAP
jgi:dolichyl-phosphate-mannose-protein mannosyltransferase